ncbi:RNA polymerase sigma factor [Wenyingzhuangia sp. 2_MG-2023]|uniref:RNA polymerase sigma factor n=1 Tax=Wenyingzhuangia sp. 2_MG-2023 TaxID=3062639 RepID=UPI0026E40B30|nr:RNA polymerase sigma factor [Wenyingzhuangia sp. 2_MG-2023]MDO6736582.1 RNA polymerase sigma factor [Wenyingzhuangia sp. 2_MG-2023]MDO6801123.1 RNA polymerase sigma factor [Wenyingzhuangia sp. 1_MG-2023]
MDAVDVLVKKFQEEKDLKAYEQLYNMYHKSMLGVIYNILQDEDLSKDILQEVFLKVWNNIESYSSKRGRFFTWLLNISRNAAIDKTRSKEYKELKKNQSIDIFVNISQPEEKEISDEEKTLYTKIQKLSENCRKLIDLIFYKGYTQKETSEELDIPLGTVKTRSRSCLNSLKLSINQ